jgi:hypothetical protein
MKTTLTILIALCSIAAMGQTDKSKADTTQWFTVGKWGNSTTWNQNQSDTAAVYMLVTYKTNHDTPVELRQIKGYSVTPRIAYNSLPFATYLYINKKPIPDNYIVWMSVKR